MDVNKITGRVEIMSSYLHICKALSHKYVRSSVYVVNAPASSNMSTIVCAYNSHQIIHHTS
jgi:hypothetical protein